MDALGKYNFHRFLNLFEAYGIYHGIVFDNDNEKNEHQALNRLMRIKANRSTLADPFGFNDYLEKHLGLAIPGRGDQKPRQILKTLEDNTISEEQTSTLHSAFCATLALPVQQISEELI